MTYEEELEYILRDYVETIPSWIEICPKVYYNNGVPYGLVGTIYNKENDTYYIASCTSEIELPFTKGMIRDIISYINNSNVCIIFENNGISTEKIRSSLARYEGDFKDVVDTHLCWFNKRGV